MADEHMSEIVVRYALLPLQAIPRTAALMSKAFVFAKLLAAIIGGRAGLRYGGENKG
jgi:hypothetical protein